MAETNYWDRLNSGRVSRRSLMRGVGVGAAGLAGAALIGCGEKEGASGGSGTPTAGGTTATGGAPATNAPKYGGTITIGGAEGQPHGAPRNSTVAADMMPFSIYGDGYNWVGGDGKLRPNEGLFEKTEFADATTYVGKLRPGITFHDGTPFNAAAAKAHLDFIRDTKKAPVFAYRTLLTSLDSVSTVDDLTVSFKLKNPDVAFPIALGVNPGIPFSVAEVEKSGDRELVKPIMTGPYKVDKIDPAGDNVFVKNEKYWGAAKNGYPYADRIIVKRIPQAESRAAALETGELDVILMSGDQTTLALSKKTNILGKAYQAGGLLIYVNGALAPFNDLRIRQAMAHSIDKKKVAEVIYFGQADVSTGWLQPKTYGFSDYEPYPYDQAKAKALMAASGVKLPLEVPFYYGGGGGAAATERIITIYQESMNAVGFNVKLTQLPSPADVQKQMFDDQKLALGSPLNIAARPDPGLTYQVYLHSSARFNVARKMTEPFVKQIDDLLAKGQAEQNVQAREELYKQVHKLARDNVYSHIPIVSSLSYIFARPRVGGFDHPDFVNGVAGGGHRPRYLWLKS